MLGLGNTITGGAVLEEDAWTPDNISSLIHWYKNDTGITTDASDDVTIWADQKGSNNLTSSGTGAHSPIWDDTNKAVHFNASGDIMTFGSALDLGKFSIYVRCEMSGFDGDYLFEETANEFWKIHSASAIRVKIAGGARHDISSGVSLSINTKYNFGLEREDTGGVGNTDDQLYAFIDGNNKAFDSGDGTQVITDLFEISRIGKPATDVKFYEIIICDDALSSSDRTELQTYLASI